MIQRPHCSTLDATNHHVQHEVLNLWLPERWIDRPNNWRTDSSLYRVALPPLKRGNGRLQSYYDASWASHAFLCFPYWFCIFRPFDIFILICPDIGCYIVFLYISLHRRYFLSCPRFPKVCGERYCPGFDRLNKKMWLIRAVFCRYDNH